MTNDQRLLAARAADDSVSPLYPSGALIERAYVEDWSALTASLSGVWGSGRTMLAPPPPEFGLWVFEGHGLSTPHGDVFAGVWRRPFASELQAIASGRRPWHSHWTPSHLEPLFLAGR